MTGSCEHGNESLGSKTRQEISLVSQGLCSIELVS
jgi:hypothetical protein